MWRKVALVVWTLWLILISVECIVVHEDETDAEINLQEKRTRIQSQKNASKISHQNTQDFSTNHQANIIPKKHEATSRLKLINQVVKELKNVLNKKTLPTQAKSSLINEVFNADGDPKKVSIAKEIFRKILEPSKPTNGAVGDLGAEMIKVSVLSRSHFNTTTAPNNLSKRRKRRHRKHRRRKKTKSAGEKITNFERNVSKTQYKPSPKNHRPLSKSTPKQELISKYIHNTAKLKRNTYRFRKANLTLLNILARRRKYFKYELQPSLGNKTSHEERYHLVKVKNDPGIDMRGKTAKLLSLKIHSPKQLVSPVAVNGTNTSISRKDLVIELDDSNNDDEYQNGRRRGFNPIMSLLNRITKSNAADVDVFDERDDNDRDDSDYDDGFISPRRRHLGENLFLNSFSDENDDDDGYNDSEEDYNNRFRNVENNLSDLYEPQLERQLAPYKNDARDEFDAPYMYDQGEENFFNNVPTNTYDPEKPIIMEVDRKR